MTKFARFERDGKIAFGTFDSSGVRELEGGPFDPPSYTGKTFEAAGVRLLAPCVPPKIMAVGLNYRSHLGERKAPENPEMFYKPITALQDPEGPIVIPEDAVDLHFEGELVVVIGKKVRHASPAEAEAAVFGVTCGNDVSDRNWQHGPGKDNQWWRAKGCDTFAPLGPVIVTGLDYGDLALTTRVNGVAMQEQRTSDLIFSVPTVISFVSRYVTLMPGDVIYTGTPGNTQRMHPGDVVEIEIEGIGILRNTARNPVQAA